MFEKIDFIAQANKVAEQNKKNVDQKKEVDLLAQKQEEIIENLNIPNGEIDSVLAEKYAKTDDSEVVGTPLYESIIGHDNNSSEKEKNLRSIAKKIGLTFVGLLITLSSFSQMNKGSKELNKTEQGTPENKDDLASKYEKGLKPEKTLIIKKTENFTTTDYIFATNENGTGAKVIQIKQDRNEDGNMGTAYILVGGETYTALSNGISGEPHVSGGFVVYLDRQGNPASMKIEEGDIHGIIQ
jgi:hypothetical protein